MRPRLADDGSSVTGIVLRNFRRKMMPSGKAQRVNMKYDNRQCQEDTATVFIKEPSCIFLQ